MEIEYYIQKEDSDGKGNSAGWYNYDYHPTFEEAYFKFQTMKKEGSFRLVKTTVETLLTFGSLADDPLAKSL